MNAAQRKTTGSHSLVGVLFTVLVVSLPLSVKIYFPDVDLEVIFPAEPLIALFGLVIAISFVRAAWRPTIDRRFIKHPISLVVVSYLVASLVSMAFSTMPLVSAKASLVRTAYIGIFYFSFAIMGPRALRVEELIHRYGLAFFLVVLFTFWAQGTTGFDREGASHASFPFFPDHTIYAAVLVFVMCWTVMTLVLRYKDKGLDARTWVLMLITIGLIVALYFSFCRAAWLSMAACIACLPLLLKRFRPRTYVLAGAVVVVAMVIAREPLVRMVRSSSVDSNSDNAGLRESVLSLTNINTDASNKERLNRWKCAWLMFKDKPMLGFGPGTYQFQYHIYQQPDDYTYLSVFTPLDPERITRAWSFSDRAFIRAIPQILQEGGGTAHSEYFMALAETGIFCFIALLSVIFVPIILGARLMRSMTDPRSRMIAVATWCALAAYAVHAFFNNYLDDCRVAFLFWSFIALITRLDLSRRSLGRSIGDAGARVP